MNILTEVSTECVVEEVNTCKNGLRYFRDSGLTFRELGPQRGYELNPPLIDCLSKYIFLLFRNGIIVPALGKQLDV